VLLCNLEKGFFNNGLNSGVVGLSLPTGVGCAIVFNCQFDGSHLGNEAGNRQSRQWIGVNEKRKMLQDKGEEKKVVDVSV
jgi:hypothetical protein